MTGLVVISGCSGGGKSTLLAELASRRHAVVDEPGRHIVRDQLACGGTALPWVDMAAFAREALRVSRADHDAARGQSGWVFFDRGVVDAANAVERSVGEPAIDIFGRVYRYHSQVFFAPPWPEIYTNDAERHHGLDAAITECDELRRAYTELGYEVVCIPKVSVKERANFVTETLWR